MATKLKPDVQRFRENKNRVLDYFAHNAETVRRKKTVKISALAFGHLGFLCREVIQFDGRAALGAEDRSKFDRIARKVADVLDDYADAVKTGAFVDASAVLWNWWRFLVRCVEATYRRLLDVEDQFDLGERLKPEHQDKIIIDLEQDITDEGNDDAPPPRTTARRPEPAGDAGAVAGLGTGPAIDDNDLPGGPADEPAARPVPAPKGRKQG